MYSYEPEIPLAGKQVCCKGNHKTICKHIGLENYTNLSPTQLIFKYTIRILRTTLGLTNSIVNLKLNYIEDRCLTCPNRFLIVLCCAAIIRVKWFGLTR
jgi:hypothetical protein